MGSAKAHGWLIVGFINDHLRCNGEDQTKFCSRCCAVCRAWKEYFFTERGRAEADNYFGALSPEDRNWTWSRGGRIDWDEINRRMTSGVCPGCQKEER